MDIPKKNGLTVWERIRFSVWPSIQNWATPLRLVGLLILAGTIVGAWTSYLAVHPEGFQLVTFVTDFYANASTELGSIAITVLVLDTLNEYRARRERKKAIIEQLGSRSNDFALEAARIAVREGWDEDGSLREVELWEASLQGADLLGFNLQGAILQSAKLQGASLRMAKLQRADLGGANLEGADLTWANLEGASLIGANLNKVEVEIEIDSPTILPDGSYWTRDTDMGRFTNRNHPDFWRSSDPRSPTYLPPMARFYESYKREQGHD